MRYLLPLLAAFPLLHAQYIWDGFNDGNADGWTIWPNFTTATYEVTDSLTYHMHYTGSDTTWAMAYWDTEMPVADYIMLMDFITHAPTSQVGMSARLGMDGTAYTAYANQRQNLLTIGKYDPDWVPLESVSYYLAHEQYYHMKFRIANNVLSLKVWEMGETEPGWMVVTLDNQFTDPGFFAIECGGYPYGSFSAEFDNIMVADSIPDALNQVSWAGIKSAF